MCGGADHFSEKYLKKKRDKEKVCAAGDLDKQRSKHTPWKCFRYGSVDHLIAKFPKTPKDNKQRWKQVRINKRGKRASQKECKNSDNDNDQNIYASMAGMSDNDKMPRRYFVDFWNWPISF